LGKIYKIIHLTLLTDLIGSVCGGIVVSFVQNVGIALYGAFFVFWISLLPTLVGVIVYTSTISKIEFRNTWVTFVMHSLLLAIGADLLFFLWSIINVCLFSTFSWIAVWKEYRYEFLGFWLVVAFQSVALPILYQWQKKKLQKAVTNRSN